VNYLPLFSLHNLALFSDWLKETSELYVDVYRPHSGGGSAGYFIRTMNDFKSLIAEQDWPEISITVFRRMQFPLRGIADDELLEKALQQIPDGEPYAFVSMAGSNYPSFVAFWGSGKSHSEFRREYAEVLGEEVGIGQDPFDIYDGKWLYTHSSEVFRLSLTRNQNYYEAYANNPDEFKWVEDLWRQ
jgi:hypothetical protein